MKKLFVLLGVLAMSAGVVFAQNNSSTIQQNDGGNSADVTQTGLDNTNVLLQSTNNDFILNQNGEANYSRLRQVLYGGNEATVEQIGTGNVLVGMQGTSNLLELSQDGTGNRSDVYQDMSDHELYITQVGVDNSVESDQDAGAGSIATLVQDGTENSLTVNQQSDGYHTLEFTQTGENNMGTTFQSGVDQYGKATQTGNWNTVDMTQTGNAHWSEVTQAGNGNSAIVTQQD